MIRTAVIDDVTAANSVSEPELTVLVHLNKAGGTSRQNALVASTGWDRSRLS
ncbi:MarR family transcriptional regulator, partial [Streptomyces sp. SID10244]|nr:MarR family transcriptional regulator [Streptomyces sp. SID10244]